MLQRPSFDNKLLSSVPCLLLGRAVAKLTARLQGSEIQGHAGGCTRWQPVAVASFVSSYVGGSTRGGAVPSTHGQEPRRWGRGRGSPKLLLLPAPSKQLLFLPLALLLVERLFPAATLFLATPFLLPPHLALPRHQGALFLHSSQLFPEHVGLMLVQVHLHLVLQGAPAAEHVLLQLLLAQPLCFVELLPAHGKLVFEGARLGQPGPSLPLLVELLVARLEVHLGEAVVLITLLQGLHHHGAWGAGEKEALVETALERLLGSLLARKLHDALAHGAAAVVDDHDGALHFAEHREGHLEQLVGHPLAEVFDAECGAVSGEPHAQRLLLVLLHRQEVERRLGRLRILPGVQFDEAEPLRRVEEDLGHLSVVLEELSELILGEVARQVPDEEAAAACELLRLDHGSSLEAGGRPAEVGELFEHRVHRRRHLSPRSLPAGLLLLLLRHRRLDVSAGTPAFRPAVHQRGRVRRHVHTAIAHGTPRVLVSPNDADARDKGKTGEVDDASGGEASAAHWKLWLTVAAAAVVAVAAVGLAVA
uniref:Uncharacterized protein n=1 Tax=Ixodes ricinus TaxID=34613 RepID=A0A6B0VEC2_IXORI